MLWLCLGLPKLSLEIFTRATLADNRRRIPLAVSEGEGRAQQVLIANEAAYSAGIRRGMPLAAAHALAAGLQVVERDVVAEQAALDRMAAWALQFTSHVHITSSQALLLEVEGSLKIFEGLDNLRRQIHEGCTALGYDAVLSVAPTPLAATWLARAYDETPVTDLRSLAGRLFEMPLHCLDVTEEQCELLRGMGLRSLGECLRLPRDGLARRLGAAFVVALDRAFGRLPDPRRFFVAPENFQASLALAGGVDSSERILFPLNRLLLELGGFLTARVAGVHALELRLRHPKAESTRVHVGLVHATRDTSHLIGLFRERLLRMQLPEAVEEMTLSAPRILPLAAVETDFFDGAKTKSDAAAELIERLSMRLGREAVRGIAAVADHRPERAWRYVEPGTMPAPQVKPIPRPLWLLPEPLLLDTRNGRPCLDGALEIEADRERVESGWWDGKDVRRDYFVARDTAGAWLWVYRELCANSRWWLHGVFG